MDEMDTMNTVMLYHDLQKKVIIQIESLFM